MYRRIDSTVILRERPSRKDFQFTRVQELVPAGVATREHLPRCLRFNYERCGLPIGRAGALNRHSRLFRGSCRTSLYNSGNRVAISVVLLLFAEIYFSTGVCSANTLLRALRAVSRETPYSFESAASVLSAKAPTVNRRS